MITSEQSQLLFRASQLTVAHRNSTRSGPVLSDVTFDLTLGQSVTLVGPNGSGKSTLLNVIAGPPNTAGLVIQGDVKRNLGASQERQARMAFLRQKPVLFPWLRVRANVAFAVKSAGVAYARRKKRLDELMTQFDLERHADKYPYDLSGGERHRVALSQVVALRPSLLLLDEPFAATDDRQRDHLRGIIQRLHQVDDMSVITVTHDLHSAASLGSIVWALIPTRGFGSRLVIPRGLSSATTTLEQTRLAAALATLFRSGSDHLMDQREALDIERQLGDKSTVYIAAVEPEREYEAPNQNPFWSVVTANLRRKVKYHYFFPDLCGRWNEIAHRQRPALQPNIATLVHELGDSIGKGGPSVAEVVQVSVAARQQIMGLSGDCVVIETDGQPVAGWYFPLAFDYSVVLKFAPDRLQETWALIQKWRAADGATRVFPH